MRSFTALRIMCVMVCALASTASIASAAGAPKNAPKTHHLARKVKGHARPSEKKLPPKVWTLHEDKYGTLHKLAPGAPFYGRVDFGGRLILKTEKEESDG